MLYLSKEKLRELYEEQKLTTYQIAKRLRCCQATVWKRLVYFNIKRRKPHELYSNVPSKEQLVDLYLKKKMSTWKIERLYGFSRGTIHRKLREFGLKTRSLADSNIKYPRKDFSGDLADKAYLIGFRIGDLGVRKIYPNSKTICVASGSTIPEQIDLIRDLFKKYGKVWIKKTKNNKINIQVNLNESFDFLLSKEFPRWIPRNKKYFFAFLAGFTDAEGWIGVYNNMAVYSLGTYDYKILGVIKENLNKSKITTIPIVTDKRKGKATTEGYFFSSDYHTLKIHKKADLLNLFDQIKPYLRHENKIKALNKAIDNIEWRNVKYGNK